MKVLVTGGAGFIGSHLVERLVGAGHEVTVLDDLSTGRRDRLDAVARRIAFLEGDVRDARACRRAARGAEVVYHQAALSAVGRSIDDPSLVFAVNVMGTLTVLEAAREAGARRVVFASSSSVYGNTPTLPKSESDPLLPLSPYAASKVSGEALCRAYQASMGLETVALRYFNVYGPRQDPGGRYAAVVPLFIQAMAEGRMPFVHGTGQQTRDFTYVEDATHAIQLAGETAGAAGHVLNVGAGGRASILELARLVAAAVGYTGAFEHGPPRVGDVRDSQADVERAREVLGWTPRIGLAEGVARVASAFLGTVSR
jgi:UDP-glucose 4-epimerase